jgi:hypothetical protein
MMVLADSGGLLTVCEAPTQAYLAQLTAGALPGAFPGPPAPVRWAPKVARIKAHKSGILAAASVVSVLTQ